jgi:hypothetical protein
VFTFGSAGPLPFAKATRRGIGGSGPRQDARDLRGGYLEECLPKAEYWDVPVADQTETTAPARLIEFLENRT